MTSINAHVPVKAPSDLTSQWLIDILKITGLSSFATDQIGTGQVSECYRVLLFYKGGSPSNQPESVILKVTSQDPTSRAAGITLGIYEKEIQFYTFVAKKLKAVTTGLAKCYHASYDGESVCLLLSDSAPAQPGNDILGITLDEAKSAVAVLAKIHKASFENAEWEKIFKKAGPAVTQTQMKYFYGAFIARYEARVSKEHRSVCDRFVAAFDLYNESGGMNSEPAGLVHGDYRADNMLFGTPAGQTAEESGDFTIVDWQTITWGSTFGDLAYFFGCALEVDERRAHSEELIKLYHEHLGPDSPFTLEQCQEGVKTNAFFGVTMAIASAILVKQTPRGDDMFLSLLSRHCDHVLDLNSLSLLPEAKPVDNTPIHPKREDEVRHKPGPEELFNESWYFDVVDMKSGIGAYVRLGTYPNQGEGKTWYTTLICPPGKPAIAVLDFEAPLPGEGLTLKTDIIDASQGPEENLKSYRVHLKGKGEIHEDPAAILRGEKGTPTDVSLDLLWETVGTPYQYRITTRYEIPCAVSGTITAGGETWKFEKAPGQRDHSWGVRDWWSADWVWQAVHLDDGTRFHGLDLRLPEMPKMYMGYAQGAGLPITELEVADAKETLQKDGLVTKTDIKYVYEKEGKREEVSMTLTSQGHGPLRLTGSDGRVALFPRWWSTVETTDGRKGVAWTELNHQLK